MKISILLPVFNAEKYLSNCLNSILQQTEMDWELLAVNDFSTDHSKQILDNFAKKDSRIQVLQNVEKGIIPALRLAFQNSKGQFITRMDADDEMPAQKLMTLKSMLLEKGKGMVATGCVQYFSETTLGNGYLKYEKWLNDLTIQNNNFSEIYKECVIASPCWMIYREDLIRCGAFEADIYPEDYDLVFRFYENQLKVLGSNEVLHRWRDHSNRSSRTMKQYANNQYFALKLPYFLKLDYDRKRPLVLWGAGKKGKHLARMLQENEVSFHWVCDNEKKWGIELFGTKMTSFLAIKNLENPQLIVAVASPDGQREILDFLEKETNLKRKQIFWFA